MIAIDRLHIRSGSFELREISLSIPSGCYAVLMGQSGQGKTTIVEAICGLRPIAGGSIVLGGHDVTAVRPGDRGLGYVPQDLALFPTMSVREHLEFALRLRRVPAAEIAARVDVLAERLGITHLLPRGVRHLSAGESQRVALGRALAFRPEILLLDEPLASVDEGTRGLLCDLLRSLHDEAPMTVLHVTHSRSEALAVADRLFVLADRRVTERPLTVLAEPLEVSPGDGRAGGTGEEHREPMGRLS